jgi:hypothetical protein
MRFSGFRGDVGVTLKDSTVAHIHYTKFADGYGISVRSAAHNVREFGQVQGLWVEDWQG